MSCRATSLEGPWEEDPTNPIMHARHETNAKFQGPGHGEVFNTQNGEWFLTYHAYELSHYSLGRQMCMEPVSWTDDGWWRPVGGRIPSEQSPAPALKAAPCQFQDSDDFESTELGKQWFFHTDMDTSGDSWSLTEAPGSLRIKTREGDLSSPPVATSTFLQRVMHKRFEISTKLTFDAREGNEAAGLHLYHDPLKNIWLTSTVVDGEKMFEVGYYDKPYVSDVDPAELEPGEIMQTYRNAPKVKTILAQVPNTIGNTVFLKMSIDGHETARFHVSADGETWTALDAEVTFGDAWHHSRLGNKPGAPDLGWVGCGRDNVWTGTAMGVFACQNGEEQANHADFHCFDVVAG